MFLCHILLIDHLIFIFRSLSEISKYQCLSGISGVVDLTSILKIFLNKG